MPDTAIPGHCLSHVLLTDAADTSVGKSPPGPKPSATAAARTARHGHSSPDSLPHHQQSVDSSMDGVRLSRSPTGISRSLTPQAKAAAHQHQQSINYRPLPSSDMIKQLLVTAAIATSQDPKPSPSEARDSRLKGFNFEDCTWEPRNKLENAPLRIKEYRERLRKLQLHDPSIRQDYGHDVLIVQNPSASDTNLPTSARNVWERHELQLLQLINSGLKQR